MLSPDERVLYVTNGGSILAFDVQADGGVTNRRDFAKLEAGGNGDGMAIDAAGRLYVTSQPGVQVFDRDGKYLGLIPTPRNAISVAFAGRDKKTLYIVGSGALGADGKEFTTPEGVRNNAKTIYKLPMLAKDSRAAQSNRSAVLLPAITRSLTMKCSRRDLGFLLPALMAAGVTRLDAQQPPAVPAGDTPIEKLPVMKTQQFVYDKLPVDDQRKEQAHRPVQRLRHTPGFKMESHCSGHRALARSTIRRISICVKR
jgi:hypothetical protein